MGKNSTLPFSYVMKIIHLLVLLFLAISSSAQDTTRKKSGVKAFANDFIDNFFIARGRTHDSVFFQKSERYFQPYAGKIIRKTIVRKLGFGESVLDTSENILNSITRLANSLQSGTRPGVIQQFMFVKPGQSLDPFQLADNERLFRELDFVKDARIRVRPVPGNHDSVDVIVVVRDVFSWGGKADASGINSFSGTIYDANLFGAAQRLEYTALYDKYRQPKFGSEIMYRKYNVGGSFTDIQLTYSNIDKGISLGDEYETSLNLKLDRPLYTPNAKFAGGMNLSWNVSKNRYEKPDSIFRDYEYGLTDVWGGYNFGTRTTRFLSEYREDDRKRKFAAMRVYNQHFSRKPVLEDYNYLYTDKLFVLGEFSWYKLNYYRTNYIFGFGRTEDLPVGITRKFTSGYTRIDSIERPYFGWEYNHWLESRENYLSYTLALGTNYYKGSFEDNSLLFNMSWFSRLFNFRRFKLRQFLNMSYAGIGNYHLYDQLRIDNEFGIQRFRTDSIRGLQRLSLGTETAIFTRLQLLGFRIGFFTFARGSLLAPQGKALFHGDIYSALGGGFRTANENLIFGTIEGRITWFPRTVGNINSIVLTLSSNVRFRFSRSFVQAPWFASIR